MINIMEIEIYKIIPFAFSLIAITISIATIFFTRQNLKRQLRLGKLEEILEILQFLDSYYRGLFMLFKDTEEKIEHIQNQKKMPAYLEELSRNKESFTEMFDMKTLINKVSRLNVLSKSYLPNKKNLKSKALTIADVYFAMYYHVKSDGNLRTKKTYTIIPKPIEMKCIISELEDQIIFEMKLGYKNIGGNEHYKYYKNQFQRDLSNAVSLEKEKREKENSISAL
ncbi:hypothetical protein GCM10011518_37160 [Flavobacterium limi]|uniref:Uncharacterized protein n=2 Tax=Flavobacterium limi TaxID=2045105 RepID=A0ABQ1UQN6_9FLAO|nr:hypothetical protein GCM10011518_37160 [Flavobacterium limi]